MTAKEPLAILIVEDEAITAMSLRLELERAGYTIDSMVATGEAAITRVEHARPDIVLMDIRLAGRIDGWDAARQIRRTCPAPIIFMTGYEKETLLERAAQLHPSSLLAKPVNIHDLVVAIEAFGRR